MSPGLIDVVCPHCGQPFNVPVLLTDKGPRPVGGVRLVFEVDPDGAGPFREHMATHEEAS